MSIDPPRVGIVTNGLSAFRTEKKKGRSRYKSTTPRSTKTLFGYLLTGGICFCSTATITILLTMACLSILGEDGVMIGCANPIYLTSKVDYRPGAKLTFEVLEADASYLKRLLGKVETFGFDLEHAPFCAQLTSLQLCESTVLALALLRDKPAMRGVLTIHGTINLANEN